MNCVNCGCRLTFFNETDELWSGTERVFCTSCRKKITPFLEEPALPDNLTHLRDRRDALLARGVTVIVLTSTPSTLSLVDGDEIYAKNGRIISEEEMYNSFYGAAGE